MQPLSPTTHFVPRFAASDDTAGSSKLNYAGHGQDCPQATLASMIAEALMPALADPTLRGREARDLALAKSAGARDLDTSSGGATVRNVMNSDEALDGHFLDVEPPCYSHENETSALRESGLLALIKGRDYIAITHGEGEAAEITVILNDSVNKNVPTALTLWSEGRGAAPLMESELCRLFRSAHDRLVVGPLAHHETHPPSNEYGLHHEVQKQQNCALHAINGMVGRQAISKAEFDQFIIAERLRHFDGAGVNEDDFYRNTPLNENLAHLYDFDQGLQPDVVEALVRNCLPGRLDTSPVNAEGAELLDLAEYFQQARQGMMLFTNGHYVAFHPVCDAATGFRRWYLIESMRNTQLRTNPAEYLHQALDHGPCVLFGWNPLADVPPPI